MKKYVKSSSDIDSIEYLASQDDPVNEDDLVESIRVALATLYLDYEGSFKDAVTDTKDYYLTWIDRIASDMKEKYNL